VRPPRLIRTASFKLAALYALIFGASVVVLAAVVYFTATAALDQQTRTRIAAESLALRGEYTHGGLDHMMDAIRDRQRWRLAGGLDYAVFRAGGPTLFGTIPKFRLVEGWARLKGPADGDEKPGHRERLLVLAEPLSLGLWLVVGDDVGHVRDVGKLIAATFGWALLLVITLAIAGGVALSAGFLGRVDAITRTAEAIIGGDIQRRIPLRGANDDLDRLAATLNRMLDRIASLMETLRQVSSDIAHDLRTPLGRVRQTLDEARRTARTTAEYEAAVDHAVAETDAMLETFAALLRIAQIESGTRRAGFRQIDLSELTETIGQTFVPVAEDAGKHLETCLAANVRVDGDRELLMQMLANLVENAIHHTPVGARIAITLDRDGETPTLTILDDGPGIPLPDQKRVFERFYRLERSRTTTGSGLGLSLVAAIADLHGASLDLENNNPGLRVVVKFTTPWPRPAEPSSTGDIRL